MARITVLEKGQIFWTVQHGEICQRMYDGFSEENNSHVIRFVEDGKAIGGYLEIYPMAYEFESDLLEMQLEDARKKAEEAVAQVPRLELQWRNALKAERDARPAQA